MYTSKATENLHKLKFIDSFLWTASLSSRLRRHTLPPDHESADPAFADTSLLGPQTNPLANSYCQALEHPKLQ